MTPDPKTPEGLPPLPPVPEGYDRWVYRGCMVASKDGVPSDYACPGEKSWRRHARGFNLEWRISPNSGDHVIEAVRDEPASEPDLTKLWENGKKAWKDVPDPDAWLDKERGNDSEPPSAGPSDGEMLDWLNKQALEVYRMGSDEIIFAGEHYRIREAIRAAMAEEREGGV